VAVNKNFVVKNGLEVGDSLIYAVDSTSKVGIASTVPSATLGVNGGIAAVNGLYVGIVTNQSTTHLGVGGTTLTANTGTGRVGINSTSPRFQLDIVGSGRTSLFINGGDIYARQANFSGIVTASSYRGDGSQLSGLPQQGVGINSGGTNIGYGVTTLNFIGIGNTFLLNGTTVDISIQGGGGGVGTAINYASNNPSPFSYIDGSVVVGENITFDDTNAGLGSSFIVVQEPELLIDPGSTVTVGAGKTLVTDLFMLNNRPDLNPNLRLTTLSVTGVTTLGVVTAVDSIGVDDIFATTITASNYFGDGSNLTNTGSTLTAGSGSQRLVQTTLVSGTMTTSATSSGLTFDNSTNTITAGIFSGSGASLTNIPNGALTNSTISGISLGGTLGTLTMAVSGTGLSGSDTYDGSGSTTFTVTSNATSSNTVSTIVARDGSGDFSAGTITASLSGNATSATSATNAANITLADESSDSTCFPIFAVTATGNQAPKTDASALTYDASTGTLAATNVNSTSDVNLKTEIHNIEDAIAVINQIRGVRFKWKDLDVPSVGVIAQEVEEILPELISTRADNGTKSVNYNGLVGVLIEAVKELSVRVEHLESQLNNK
jgi:hypothetical protein